MAEKDFVIVHGRFSGNGRPVNWIAADIVRIKDGISCRALGRAFRMKRRRNSRKQAAHVRKDFPDLQMSRSAEVRYSSATTEKTMPKKLEGKIAVVTGGTEGLGWLRQSYSPRRVRMSSSRAVARRNSTRHR